MRFIPFFIFLLLCQFSSFAQSAYVRGNTVYTEKDEMFKLYNVGTIRHPAYKIKNLNENELILIDQSTLRNNQGTILMKFMFEGMPNMEAYLPYSVNFKKQLARLLVNYNVVKNNKLNAEGVAILCKNYNLESYPSKYIASDLVENPSPKRRSDRVAKVPETKIEQEDVKITNQEEVVEQPQNVVTNNNNEISQNDEDDIVLENGIVKRDTKQQLYLSGSKIRQDYKEIGSFKEENKLLLGQEGKQVTFFGYSGDKIAIARFINTDEQCELLTVSDNKTWNIPLPKGDIYTIVKDIVQVLIDKSLL
ncbi:MAG: hypothetical protein IT215_05140 [Chitinophagaceae bacterium]|nr:hypothetical protein [Chitinophagaceae bacterium]HMN32919.1 hypothetical protein [Chitinophagaceae bacterium]